MLDERGMALPLTLLVVLVLAGLGVGLLAVGAMEPQISRNLVDTARARAVADAGTDWALNTLIASPDWSALLAATAGANCNTGVTPAGWPNNAPLPGSTAASGTFTITVRNDCAAGDNAITGWTGAADPNATTDNNGILIVTSTGTANGGTRAVQVAISRPAVPPLPGAINLPGVQADTSVGNINPANPTLNVMIDGRDYNRDGTSGPGPTKKAITTAVGNQQNYSDCSAGSVSYQQKARNGFDTANKRAALMGADSSGSFTTGLNTILSDATLTQAKMTDFINAIRSNPATAVLNSTLACPMTMTGSGTAGQAQLTNGCGLNQQLSLGTVNDPKLVYFTGALDTTSQFTGLTSIGTIQGAGILVIEDGDFRINDTFRWDGLMIVTGRYIGMGLMNSSTTTVYGAIVSMETECHESSGFNEFLEGGVTATTIRYSKQNLDLAQTVRGLHRMYSVRDL